MTATSPPTRYKIGLVQMAMSADPDANLQPAIANVAESAAAGGRRAHAAASGARAALPHGDRVASGGEGDPWRRAARRLAHDPARPRDRERLLRRRREPGRCRTAGGRRRARVLGLVVPRRSARDRRRGGAARPRGGADPRGRPRPDPNGTPRLALPAGPSDRSPTRPPPAPPRPSEAP